MHLADLKYRLLGLDKLLVVEYVQQTAEEAVFVLSNCVLANGSAAVVKQEVYHDFPIALKATKLPVLLNISGKGVLVKVFDHSVKHPIQQVLPHAASDDFVVGHRSCKSTQSVAILRKEKFEAIIALFEGVNIIGHTVGPFAAVQLLEQLELSTPRFGYHHFENNAYSLSNSYNTAPVDDALTAAHLLPISLVLETLQNVSLDYTPLNTFVFQRACKTLGVGLLGFLFFVLLGNTIWWNSLRDEVEASRTKAQVFTQLINREDSLKTAISSKKDALKLLGWKSQTIHSYYIDRLVEVLPTHIKLYQVAVNPFDFQQSKKERRDIFEKGALRLSGYVNNADKLNLWVYQLEKLPWIQKVELFNYNYLSKARKGDFTLKIVIDEGF